MIGAGAIGLLSSWYLSKRHEVVVYTRTREQSDAINKSGIRLLDGGKSTSANVQSKPLSDWDGAEDLTIVTVKQYQLEKVLADLMGIAIPSALLFLQNGMGHLKLLEGLNANQIYLGSVEHGAVRRGPETVSHNGKGLIRAAVFKGDQQLLHHLAETLPEEFPVCLEEDFYPMLEGKLVVNAVINPLTAIFQVKNGVLLKNPHYKKIVEHLFAEIITVLGSENRDAYYQRLFSVCRATAGNTSSMLKDLTDGRQTEIDAILGYLLERAAEKNIAVPYIESYYLAVKGKEHEGRKQND